jgi:phosphate transport system substrate-binding protein
VRGTTIGNYRLLASLGSGGMADVFLAARLGPENFTKLLVIKRLREDLSHGSDAARYRMLLLDEARLAARMHHPNIVQTFEVTETDGEPYITMEFLDGQSISQVIRAARRAGIVIPQELALRVIGDILSALAYAHALADFDGRPLQIIHRDISPQNVFWTYDGEIKLVDFGVAKFALGSNKTEVGFIKGKVTYMAPEQARGEPLDRRADLFAVGVMMWELLTGRRLFKANSQAASLHKLMSEPIPEISELVPDLHPTIAAICNRALAREREMRYGDAATMRNDIEAVLGMRSPRREHLASFMLAMFPTERDTMKHLIHSALAGDPTTVIDLPTQDEDSVDSVEPDVESETAASKTVAARPSHTARPSHKARPGKTLPPVRGQPGRRLVVGLLAAIAVVTSTAVVIALSPSMSTDDPAPRPPAAAPSQTATATATATALTATPTPTLRLCGSNTIGAELGPALIEAFLRKKGASQVSRRPGKDEEETLVVGTLADQQVVVDLVARGSTTAFESLLAGTCDIGMSSRAIDDDETVKLSATLGDLRSPATEHVIALDGIAVVVHPNNRLRTISRSALHDVFVGKLTNWSQVGEATGAIAIYARDDRSGTYEIFKHLVLGDDPLATNAKRFVASEELADAVSTDPAAIGFIGLAYVRSAKALAIGDVGAPTMLPTSFTVTTEDYLLSRRLYFYTPPKPKTPLVAELVSFTLSTQGQDVVREAGFVDLEVALRDGDACDARCPPRYAAATTRAKRVSFDVRFRPHSDELDSRATRDLDRLVHLLQSHPNGSLLLFGFSDSTGDSATSTKPSLVDAQQVARELEQRGIHPALVEGFGDALPIAANTNNLERERNRRVEVWLRNR